jgi:thymidine phosphorylase
LYSGSAILDATEIKKRSGNLQEIMACCTSGEVPDYQMSTLLMAISSGG